MSHRFVLIGSKSAQFDMTANTKLTRRKLKQDWEMKAWLRYNREEKPKAAALYRSPTVGNHKYLKRCLNKT